MTVYFLKFHQPLGNPDNPRAQAQFYIGSCADRRLKARLAEHRRGHGAAITRAAGQRGIGFDVVLTLPGGRAEERRIKAQKNAREFIERYTRRQQAQ